MNFKEIEVNPDFQSALPEVQERILDALEKLTVQVDLAKILDVVQSGKKIRGATGSMKVKASDNTELQLAWAVKPNCKVEAKLIGGGAKHVIVMADGVIRPAPYVIKRKTKFADQVVVLPEVIKKAIDLEKLQADIDKDHDKLVCAEKMKLAPFIIRRLATEVHPLLEAARVAGLETIIAKGDYGTVVRWFKRNGFTNIPDDLTRMTGLGGYERDDAFVRIDWNAKSFTVVPK